MIEKKIGINLLSFDAAHLTGAWSFVKRLIEAMPALSDVEFVFYCQRGFDLEAFLDIPSGLRFRRCTSSVCGLRLIRILYEQVVLPLRAMGCDVLFSPIVGNPIVHPWFKTVTTIHDLTPFVVKNKYGPLQGWYVRFITRALAKRSNLIVTVSQNSKEDIVRSLRIDPSKIEVVYNFVPLRDISTVCYEPYFLCVSTLQPGKNLIGVIRSFAIFSKKYDRANHKLIIVGGQGWGDEQYGTAISESGMESRVELAGYLSDDQLNALYAKCKGVVLMSLYEGFGIPPLEALSFNKPSIVSNRASLPEVVGPTGILVDPLDCEQAALAMKAIAENPQRYLGGRDTQLAKFSPNKQVNRFLAALTIN